jgi:hypothetical protein
LDCGVEKLRQFVQLPNLTSPLCHPSRIPLPKMKRGTHQCYKVWWYSMPSCKPALLQSHSYYNSYSVLIIIVYFIEVWLKNVL